MRIKRSNAGRREVYARLRKEGLDSYTSRRMRDWTDNKLLIVLQNKNVWIKKDITKNNKVY